MLAAAVTAKWRLFMARSSLADKSGWAYKQLHGPCTLVMVVELSQCGVFRPAGKVQTCSYNLADFSLEENERVVSEALKSIAGPLPILAQLVAQLVAQFLKLRQNGALSTVKLRHAEL
jgi:hypothetical protein